MMPTRADVGRLLDARLERVGHADHRRRADAGTGQHHAPHFVPRHRAVLHLEPDEVEVLADFAVQLRVEARDRVAGDLLVLEQQLLGLVVERPRRGGVHRWPSPASPSRARRLSPASACRRSGCRQRLRRRGHHSGGLQARSGFPPETGPPPAETMAQPPAPPAGPLPPGPLRRPLSQDADDSWIPPSTTDFARAGSD